MISNFQTLNKEEMSKEDLDKIKKLLQKAKEKNEHYIEVFYQYRKVKVATYQLKYFQGLD